MKPATRALLRLWSMVSLHPIASALLFAALSASAFAYGIAWALGPAIFALLGKHDLLVDAGARMFLPALIFFAGVRLGVSGLMYVKRADGSEYGQRSKWITAGVMLLFAIALFATSLDPALLYALMEELLLPAILVPIAALLVRSNPPAGLPLALGIGLLFFTSLGRARIEWLRHAQPDAQLDVSTGDAAKIVVVASGANGIAFFGEDRAIVHFMPWDKVKSVTSLTSKSTTERIGRASERQNAFRNNYCDFMRRHASWLSPDGCGGRPP